MMREDLKRKPRRNMRIEQKRAKKKLPAKSLKLGLKVVLAAIGVIVLSMAFIFVHDWVLTAPRLAIQHIQVSGNQLLSESDIVHALGVKPGDNILKINLGSLKKQITSQPWVKKATIKRKYPDTLVVKIEEYKPYICADLGQIFMVDKAGYVFKPALAADTEAMPTIRGLYIPPEFWVDAKDFCLWNAKKGISPFEITKLLALKEFLGLCEANPQIMGLALISDIETDGLTGITAILKSGRVVKFGFNDLAKKMAHYARFEKYAEKRLTAYDIKTVDLRDVAKIVVAQEPRTVEFEK